MKVIKILFSLLLILVSFLNNAKQESQGTLVIAGGAISQTSIEIFHHFAELAGNENAKIAVVPAATNSVHKQFKLLVDAFTSQGVKASNIDLLPLAINDDKKSEEIDESTWAKNGQDKYLASKVADMTAIWFIGGDQTLITATLLDKNGNDTPVLKAIRSVYNNGGTLGGTSAGAAIMSQLMIAGGNSQGAIFTGFKQSLSSMDEQEYGPVVLANGLGFFTQGIIDQHFDRKARLGRLLVSLLHDDNNTWGFGIDEGTAMLVTDNNVEVMGEGGITIIDTRHITDFKKGQYPVQVNNVRLSFMQPGDSYDLNTHAFSPRAQAKETVEHEYLSVPQQNMAGLFNGNRLIDQFIGYNLLDNVKAKEIWSWLIEGEKKVKLRFSQDQQSQGYWNTDLTADVYSFKEIKLDVIPE